MAPIRRRRGGVNNGDESDAIGSQEHELSEDDYLSQHFEELYFVIDVHAQKMKEFTERLKTDLNHVVDEMQRRSLQVAAGEGSSQGPASTVQPELFSCMNCKTLPATMVCYPCKHLSICLECDYKISKCPVCNNLKQSSFMVKFSN